MKRLCVTFSCIFMLAFSLHSHAGWLLTGKNIDPDGNAIPIRFFIEKNKIKIEQPEFIAQFDMKTQQIILVDPVKLTYYKGSLTEYMNGVKTFKKEALKSVTVDKPTEQPAVSSKTYIDQIERFFDIPMVAKGSVTVSKTDKVFKMLGWQTEIYKISLNGLLKEEVYIAPGMKAGEGFDWVLYFRFLKAVGLEDQSLIYMNTPEYLSLLQIGYPVRKMVFINGDQSEFQINHMEEKIIPDYEFYTPSLCKELTIAAWLKQKVITEDINDDYE
jgi:hypothetical protein